MAVHPARVQIQLFPERGSQLLRQPQDNRRVQHTAVPTRLIPAAVIRAHLGVRVVQVRRAMVLRTQATAVLRQQVPLQVLRKVMGAAVQVIPEAPERAAAMQVQTVARVLPTQVPAVVVVLTPDMLVVPAVPVWLFFPYQLRLIPEQQPEAQPLQHREAIPLLNLLHPVHIPLKGKNKCHILQK
jgi:hypothetical protein